MFQLCRSLSQNIRSASHTSLTFSTRAVLSGDRLGAFEKHNTHKAIIALMKNRTVFFKGIVLNWYFHLYFINN